MTNLKKLFNEFVCLPTYKNNEGKAKLPCVDHKTLDKTYTEHTIKKVYGTKKPYHEKNIFEGHGFGMRTGKINNIVVVDLDELTDKKSDKNLKDGVNKYNELLEEYNNGDDLDTPTVRTQSGGTHIYFKYDEKIKQTQSVNGYTIDIRSDNGYVVIPPTKGYKWTKSIQEYDIMECPEWLKKWINKKVKKVKKFKKKGKKKAKKNIKMETNEVDEKLRKYLDCLKLDRFVNRDEWIRIGFIIYNEGGSCSLFDEYSRKAPNYGDVTEKWNTFGDNDDGPVANLKTLIRLCKEDDFEKYTNLLARDTESIINNIFNYGANDTNLSQLFYSYVPDGYIFDNENNELYKINKFGIYKKDSRDKRGIRKHVYDLLSSKLDDLFYEQYGEADDDKKIKILTTFRQIRKFIAKGINKKNIAEECCSLYGRDKLFEQLDNVNDYIIAFDNGVYDLKKFKFRKALPSELITCTTNYDYEPAEKKYLKKVDDVVSSIFNDKDEKDYVMKTLATCLIGDNTLEEFYIWIGNGSNGKGVLRDMISYTLGGFYDSMDIEYLCKNKFKKSATGADPVMAKKKNSRLVISTEPEGAAKLRSAKLKELSGRDPIQVRDLYKSSFNFVPKFKMIIQTNQEVEIDGADGGIRRRLKFLTFRNKFVDKPTLSCHKKIDRSLKSKIKEVKFSQAFFKTLVDYYKMVGGSLDMPETFKKETEQYLNDFDPVQRFLDERIISTNNPQDFISTTELYEEFIEYNNNSNKGIIRNNFGRTIVNKGYIKKKTKKCNGYIKIKFAEIETKNLLVD